MLELHIVKSLENDPKENSMNGLEIKFEMVSVDGLNLDLKNPRIAQWMGMYTEVDDNAMKLALQRGGSDDNVAGPSYRSLKESIKTNKGVIHPIIVNCEPEGQLTVIEGNTRALIYREFKAADMPGNWDKIPAMVYENMNESQIDAIRLQAHLVGVREWDPYSKAKYLDTLRNKLHMPWGQVVDYSGGNQRELERLIDAYNDIEKYYRPVIEEHDTHFDYTRFSGFVELQNPRVEQALLTSGFTKKDFSQWIQDRRLHPLEMVRQLPRILSNEDSKKAFLKDGAREAVKILDAMDTSDDVSLEEASLVTLLREVGQRINEIHYSEVMRLKDESHSEEKDVIEFAKDALISLWSDINKAD